MYLLYVEALTVRSAKAAGPGPTQDSARSFTTMDLMGIRDIAAERDLFKLLVHSFAPGIFGHEVVKAGLLLGLSAWGVAGGAPWPVELLGIFFRAGSLAYGGWCKCRLASIGAAHHEPAWWLPRLS